jgi:nicotinate phosphoribosyltransferase
VIKDGKVVADRPEIPEMRAMRDKDVNALDPGVLRIMNPHTYHVSLSRKLWDLKQEMIKKTRNEA